MSEVATSLQALDALFGNVLNALDDAGIREKTVLVISAKHGNSPIERTTLSRKSVYDPAKQPPAPQHMPVLCITDPVGLSFAVFPARSASLSLLPAATQPQDKGLFVGRFCISL